LRSVCLIILLQSLGAGSEAACSFHINPDRPPERSNKSDADQIHVLITHVR
jgi:hypothetical protein